MKILVTGGMGYIGSNTVVELLKNNYEVVIIDNLVNSNIEVLEKIKKITKKEVKFYEEDLRNKENLKEILKKRKNRFCDSFCWFKSSRRISGKTSFIL